MRELLANRLRLAQDNLWELTVSTDSDFKYRGFVEDWSEDELILKYVGAEQGDRCVVERWLPMDSIVEVAYVRESNLSEAWMSIDHESSLRFADEFPSEQSDVVVNEICIDFDDFDYLEGAS